VVFNLTITLTFNPYFPPPSHQTSPKKYAMPIPTTPAPTPIPPTATVKKALDHLERRRSYMTNAPHQHRTRKRALKDAAIKLSPSTWLGPAILDIRDRHAYRRDRRRVELLHEEACSPVSVLRTGTLKKKNVLKKRNGEGLTAKSSPPPPTLTAAITIRTTTSTTPSSLGKKGSVFFNNMGRPIGASSGIVGVPAEVLVDPDEAKVPVGWCPIGRDPLEKTDDPWVLRPAREIYT